MFQTAFPHILMMMLYFTQVLNSYYNNQRLH